MNWKDIRIRYIGWGAPLCLTGILIYAVCIIVDYLTRTLWDVSYPIVIFSTFIGMLFIMVGAGSFLFIGCDNK